MFMQQQHGIRAKKGCGAWELEGGGGDKFSDRERRELTEDGFGPYSRNMADLVCFLPSFHHVISLSSIIISYIMAMAHPPTPTHCTKISNEKVTITLHPTLLHSTSFTQLPGTKNLISSLPTPSPPIQQDIYHTLNRITCITHAVVSLD